MPPAPNRRPSPPKIQNEPEIAEAIARTHSHFLIIALGQSDERPPICDIPLQEYPKLKILALAPERNSAMFYWASLQIHSNRVESSEEGILEIRVTRLPRSDNHLATLVCAAHLATK